MIDANSTEHCSQASPARAKAHGPPYQYQLSTCTRTRYMRHASIAISSYARGTRYLTLHVR